MIPPGKTSLSRMQRSAQLEAQRIEITQDARVECGLQPRPRADQVEKRDDFVGIVRLIDILMTDQVLLARFEERAARMAEAAAARCPEDEEIAPCELATMPGGVTQEAAAE